MTVSTTTANMPIDVVVEDVDMDDTLDEDEIVDVDMDETNAEVETFLMQLKLQLDERDAAGVTFGFESFTSVVVQCFVPLLEHSSMLQIVPMIHLRIAEVDSKLSVEVLSNTHIYVPHELVTKSTTTYFLNLPLLQAPLTCDFVRAVPMLVTDFIKQMHIFDPQPPPPPTPIPTPLQSPPSQRPVTPVSPNSTLLPLAHFPGTLFHANDVTGSVVTAILVGVTPSSLYILHPGPTHHQQDLAVLRQVISLKDIARVVGKRGENKSFVMHFKAAGVACKPIFSQSSDRIVAMIQSYMEKHSAKRRLEHASEDHRPRHVKKSNGFDMSSFFSNMEKATKELSQKVVGGLNEVSKLLSGELPPLTLAAISQMEANFFRRPDPHQLFAIMEGYKSIAVHHAQVPGDDVADQAETNMVLFLNQPQAQSVLHRRT